MKFGIEQHAIDVIFSVLCRHLTIEKVVIYGSRAKGNYRKGSDIDLTLMGEGLSEAELSIITAELDLLNTPYLFDVSIFDGLNSELKEHIMRVGQVFYQRNHGRKKLL